MPEKEYYLNCRRCKSSRVEKTRAEGLTAVIARFFPIQTVRCLFCHKRFWVWQKAASGKQRLLTWLVLFGLTALIYLFYVWLFTADADQASASSAKGGVVTNALHTSATDSTLSTTKSLDSDDQRKLVSSLAFNQPDNQLEQEGLPEVSKSELEEKLAQAKTKVESANAQTRLQEQRVAKLADLTEELRSLLKVDINYMVEGWRQAWQSGNSEAYLGFYSAQFKPTGDVSLAGWQAQRSLRVVPTKKITLNFSNFDVVLDVANKSATVSFDQEYQSSSYSDKVRKQLTLVKVDEWRIVSEQNLLFKQAP